MQTAHIAQDRYDLLSFALDKASPQGLVLDSVSRRGVDQSSWQEHDTPCSWLRLLRGTSRRLARYHGDERQVHHEGPASSVPNNVLLHVGWFDRTLPEFLQTTAEKVALLHIDCDIYESTNTVFDILRDRIVAGTVIVFDEYFNYPGWRLHEFKAFQEFVSKRSLKYQYIGMSAEKGHVAVQIL
jgi:hypothetical protein